MVHDQLDGGFAPHHEAKSTTEEIVLERVCHQFQSFQTVWMMRVSTPLMHNGPSIYYPRLKSVLVQADLPNPTGLTDPLFPLTLTFHVLDYEPDTMSGSKCRRRVHRVSQVQYAPRTYNVAAGELGLPSSQVVTGSTAALLCASYAFLQLDHSPVQSRECRR